MQEALIHYVCSRKYRRIYSQKQNRLAHGRKGHKKSELRANKWNCQKAPGDGKKGANSTHECPKEQNKTKHHQFLSRNPYLFAYPTWVTETNMSLPIFTINVSVWITSGVNVGATTFQSHRPLHPPPPCHQTRFWRKHIACAQMLLSAWATSSSPTYSFLPSMPGQCGNRKLCVLSGVKRTMMDMEDVLHSQCWPQRENILPQEYL